MPRHRPVSVAVRNQPLLKRFRLPKMWRTVSRFRLEFHYRQYHLFHRYAAMLETIPILVDVLVKIGRVYEVVVFFRDQIIDCHAAAGKPVIRRILHEDRLSFVALEVPAEFIPEICGRFFVGDHPGAAQTADAAVVRREHNGDIFLPGQRP